MSGKLRTLAQTSSGVSGFTLVETMVTLIVVSIVGVALFQVLSVSKVNVEDQKATLEAQQNARVALNSISEDFRHVSYGKDATQPSIAYADVDSVVFVADIFENDGAEEISYYLSADGDADTPNPNDRILMKTVRDTTGAMLVNAPQSYGIAASGLQLRYFTGDNHELSRPVAQPETIGEIRILVSGVSPRPLRDGNYHTVTLSSTIYPRNLPLTPARARPNPPGNNGAEIPNCEAVTIRWIAPSQNTDGTPLALNDISHFNFYMTQDGGARALNARLNRTITERTVPGLEAGSEYVFEVTAVSRAGVESYPMTRNMDLTSGLIPEVVENVDVVISGSSAEVTWSNIDEFTDTSAISTPVYYKLYMGDVPGFAPDTTNFLAQTGDWENSHTISSLDDCTESYVKVRAVACGNASDPSVPVLVLAPAMVSCPDDVDAIPGMDTGEILVSWDIPATRTDGTSLDPNDIDYFKVYVDTVEAVNETSYYAVVGGGATSHTVVMPGCDTYYVNVAAVDLCGTIGDLCPHNEVAVTLGAPCAPGAPVTPTGLAHTAGDTDIQLTWNANTEDCDLAGYRIWYGHTAGGPYDGTSSAQGPSPITVDAEAVTAGSFANFALTGLASCTPYYVAVTAYDVCEPFEESGYSAETFVDTSCLPCTVELTCSPLYAHGDSHNEVTLGVYSSSDDQNVDGAKLTWSGPQLLEEMWVDGTKVWAADGSAGNDGAQSPVAAGTLLSPWDFTVYAWSSASNGQKMELVFDSDARGADLFIDFRTASGPCSVQGYVEPVLVADTFDDGDFNGWTVQTGNWDVTGGELRQTNDAGVFQWMHTSVLSYGGDFIVEADALIESGGYMLVQYNRDAADSRYMAYISAWSGEGHLGRFTTSYTDFGYGNYGITNGIWYRTKVVREADVYKLFVDCTLVAEAAVFPDPLAGRFGFGAYYSKVRVDDVVITEYSGNGAAAAQY